MEHAPTRLLFRIPQPSSTETKHLMSHRSSLSKRRAFPPLTPHGSRLRLACALSAVTLLGGLACGGGDDGGAGLTNPVSAGNAGAAGTSGTSGAAGKGGSKPVCEPGITRKCVGVAACEGGQACREDGAGWGPVSVKIVVQQIAFRPPAPAFESDSPLGSG
jgi:hypothetical protein